MPSDLQVSNIKDLTGSNTGLSIASDGQVSITQNNPTIQLGSNTTFPAGQILQAEYAFNDNQTTVGDTNTYILNPTITTKGANSRILVLSNLLYGASGDDLGFHGGITMTTGSSASTDYDNDAIQKGQLPALNTGFLEMI